MEKDFSTAGVIFIILLRLRRFARGCSDFDGTPVFTGVTDFARPQPGGLRFTQGGYVGLTAALGPSGRASLNNIG